MQMNEMPSIGTTLTYGEAIKAYDRFERTMLEKAYGAGLLPAVGLYDLLWQLELLAQKFGIEGKGAFSRLKREIRSFASERTALANGVNSTCCKMNRRLSSMTRRTFSRSESTGISSPATSTRPSSCFQKSLPRSTCTPTPIHPTDRNGIPTDWVKTLS